MLNYVPEKYFSLFIAIDCLHEMGEESRSFFQKSQTKSAAFYTPKFGKKQQFH
jgi:hypothetical protein